MYNFKKTEIGEIPKNWGLYKLGNYVNLIKGISYRSEDYCLENEGHIFINLKCVARNGGFRKEGIKFYKGDVKEEQFVKPGDIVIANTDLTQNREIIGSPIKIPDIKSNRKMCISLDISKIDIIDKKLNNDFLYYYLMSPNARYFMISNSNGTTVLHLSTNNVSDMLIPLPTLAEQRAIASVLSSFDDKIDLLHRENKTLEQMAEALFRQWFVDSDYSCKVSDLIEIQNGYAFKSKDFKDVGVNGVIKIKNISGNIVDIYNCDFIDELVASQIGSRFVVETGDILFAMTGAEIGKMGIVPQTERKLLLNQRVGIFKEKYNGSRFLAYLQLKSDYGQDYIDNTATGSAQPNISSSGIVNCDFPNISKEQIIIYSEQLSSLFAKIIFNLGQIRTLEKMRDTLLPKLMSGEVRVAI